MKSQELRQSWVDFFTSKGHVQLPSASLIPDVMSTTLFTIAGMEQFVPVFLGEAPPPAPRAVTIQPCLRVAGAKSDIEHVGRTGRHGTFLEMLGNFSFGDYYKREAIAFAWEYLVDRLKLPADKLWVTVHTDDDEAQGLWESEVGLPPARISRFDADNFWTMGPTGPCGPSTEIFFDTGSEHASGPGDIGPNRGDRFLEIWNLVFQQYNRTADGVLHDLPKKAIDTGAGFERVLAIANGKASMYETDLFTDLIAAQPDVGTTALPLKERVVRRRIVADHARAATFLIADGVYPSNTDRGYVLRFLIRRAIRNGKLLGYPNGFLTALVPAVVNTLAPGYPELAGSIARVEESLGAEELGFERTLERGNDRLSAMLDAAKRSAVPLEGRATFELHDTYGFPVELTREIAAEAGVAVDSAGFEEAMEEQRERARSDAAKKRAVVGIAELPAFVTEFTGYDGLETDGKVLAMLRDGIAVEDLVDGDEAQVILDRTSFYAEKGGQIGDQGIFTTSDGATFRVFDTQYLGEAVAHRGILQGGPLVVGDVVHTAVDPFWRQEIRRHHTSAHLLQRALKDVLGDEVVQAGSWVGIDRMRFDFRWPSGALTPDQKRDVVASVNAMIRDDHHLVTKIMSPKEAAASGAISMPGEKYGDRIRVVYAGPAVEFCGGTHSITTGELGMFLILSESSIGQGIRRIESVVSRAAETYALEQQDTLATLSESLSAKPTDLGERVGKLQIEIRDLQRALGDARAQLAAADAGEYVASAKSIAGKRVVAAVLRDVDAEALKRLAAAIDKKFDQNKEHARVVALAGISDGMVSLVVSASAGAVKGGVHAGQLVKLAAPLIGGRGGGQAAQAQGGGKNPDGAEAAIDAIQNALARK